MKQITLDRIEDGLLLGFALAMTLLAVATFAAAILN